MQKGGLTQDRAQPPQSRLFTPSSPRYLVITLAPSENPNPTSFAFGNNFEMYRVPHAKSSVQAAEYSLGDVRGTPAQPLKLITAARYPRPPSSFGAQAVAKILRT
jgi:hypothetical protein